MFRCVGGFRFGVPQIWGPILALETFSNVCLERCLILLNNYLTFFLAVPCGMWNLSRPGIKSIPLHWRHGVLITGQPRKSHALLSYVNKSKYYFTHLNIEHQPTARNT